MRIKKINAKIEKNKKGQSLFLLCPFVTAIV